MNSIKLFAFLAAINGLLAVMLGAFGAHALKNKLSEAQLSTWQTAVHYHFYHVVALLVVAAFLRSVSSTFLSASGYCFLAGILFFCGSLYALALGGPGWLGPITPLGGLLFMAGWALLAVAALKVL